LKGISEQEKDVGGAMAAGWDMQGNDAGGALYDSGPRLLADVGATNARFALETAPGRLEQLAVLTCADYPGFVAVVHAYFAGLRGPRPRHAAVAIANPIDGDFVKMTNRDWQFSIEEARRGLDLDTLLVVNDFTALAMSLPYLGNPQRRQVGGGEARQNAVIGLIGPGTGLGVSGLIPAEDRWITLGSEGGHVSFAPADEREVFILQYAWKELPHVSAERLVSGPGLELIYRALAARNGVEAPGRSAPDIVQAVLSGDTGLCAEAVECFCAMLGTVAADVAVTLGAVGGIYIGAGIVPRLGEVFDRSAFRQRFESKGRFADYLAQIPTYVITAANPAFLGVAAILGAHLQRGESESPMLGNIRRAKASLSPAEQRVAQFLLSQPRMFLNEPIVEIARHSEVSQPTVIRFCRSLGFQGLAEFKRKLASGISGTVPVRHSQVRLGDSAPDLSVKVLDNTVSAILRFRDSLDPEAVEKAIALLQKARRIEFYGMGNSAVVAIDGQHKFFRFRIPTVAYSDSRLQMMAAELLGKDDVVVAVSRSGAMADILQAVDLALAAGASVIAITTSNSPLAAKATVALAVDHAEDGTSYISMVSRILHLLMIDILAVGVAVRLLDPAAADRELGKGLTGAVGTPAPGGLGNLISHAS
jgi:glucokinase